jgi:hypothetical protein
MTSTCRVPAPKILRYSDDSIHIHAVTLSSAESTSSFASDEPITPPAAYHSPLQVQADQIADFFGAPRKSRTRAVLPPSYSSDGDSQFPLHETKAEPGTLARFMFIYGFSALLLAYAVEFQTELLCLSQYSHHFG